jgi:uncharacterized protein (TIGR02757 family)
MSNKKSYNGISAVEMKQFLEEKYLQFNTASFVANDPVSIPHMFSEIHDIEVSGFLTATIAWGRRDLILRSSQKMINMMGNSPYDFVMSADAKQLETMNGFVHRTFNGTDFRNFIKSLRLIYNKYNSIETIIIEGLVSGGTVKDSLSHFRKLFFSIPHDHRTEKHFADPISGAAAKRLNMFMRWMVRSDGNGVDFGLWNRIKPSQLYIPIDLHSGNTARKLGLLTRKMNDWKAVEELTGVLREFDSNDPVKYDFALFGLGVFDDF